MVKKFNFGKVDIEGLRFIIQNQCLKIFKFHFILVLFIFPFNINCLVYMLRAEYIMHFV